MISCHRMCLVLMLSVLVWCEEHVHHMHQAGPNVPHDTEDGEHQEDYDHQSVLGSEDLDDEFENLPPGVARQRLHALVQQHDTDFDNIITKVEMKKWILSSFEQLDKSEAMDKFVDEDSNSDGKLSWAEYVTSVHGSFSDNEQLSEDYEEEKVLEEDRRFFKAADLNGDGELHFEEYMAFYFPQNYEHMQNMEVERFLKESDTDSDGKISRAEFMPEQASDTKSRISKEENFNDLDKDKDGFLSETEYRQWVLPETDMMVDDEVKHLFGVADRDGDGKLTMEEILDKTKEFVGSSATDYGNSLKRDEL